MLSIKVRFGSHSQNHRVDRELSLEALRNVLMKAFSLPSMHFDILSGFPPKVVELENGEPIFGVINDNEVLQIRMHNSNVTAMTSSSVDTSKLSTKRMKGKDTSASSATNKKKTPISSTRSFGATIHTLHGTTKRSTSLPRAAPKQRRITPLAATSEEDLSTHLLAAASGGTGKQNRFLRAVFRRAVELEYDQSKALARVAAAQSGKYTIRESASNRVLGSGAAATMTVQFHKGAGARSYYFETVDMLSAPMLVAVLKLVLCGDGEEDVSKEDQKKLLTPMGMASLSPRMFWSIVKLYGGDIIAGLQTLLPDEDWSKILERKRELSEKAKANLEQRNTRGTRKKRQKLSEAVAALQQTISTTVESEDTAADTACKGPIDTLAELLEKELNTQDVCKTDLRISDPLLSSIKTVLCAHITGAASTLELLFAMSNCDDTLELSHAISSSVKSKGDKVIARDWVTIAHLRFWRHRCREIIAEALWNNAICMSNDSCRRALVKSGVKCIRELRIWHHSPQDFHKLVIGQTPDVADYLTYKHISTMCNLVHELNAIDEWSWLGDWESADEVVLHPLDEVKAECAEAKDEAWLIWHPDTIMQENSDARLGDFVIMEDGDSMELGVVVAYLAAVGDDSIAVWKVLVEAGDILELEDDEIIPARDAYVNRSRN